MSTASGRFRFVPVDADYAQMSLSTPKKNTVYATVNGYDSDTNRKSVAVFYLLKSRNGGYFIIRHRPGTSLEWSETGCGTLRTIPDNTARHNDALRQIAAAAAAV